MSNRNYICLVLATLFPLAMSAVTTPPPTTVIRPSNITIVPEPVENLRAYFTSTKVIGLRWGAPNGSAPYAYKVFINKKGEHCELQIDLRCHQNDMIYDWTLFCDTTTVDDVSCVQEVQYDVSRYLLSYTYYNLSVVASNKFVTSIPSTIHVRTAVGVSGPVLDIKGTAVDNSSIQVNWTAPAHMAGPTNYSIRVLEADHRTVNSTYSRLAVYNVSGYENTELLVENLQPSWRYKFEIRVWTSAGVSTHTFSDPVMTDPAIPSVVQNLRVSYATDQYLALLVSWECPLERERRGQISHYTIQYTGNVSLTVTSGSFYTEDPCKEPHKVYLPVTPDNTYTISVVANAEFTGMSSSTTFYADLKKMMYAFSPPSNKTSPVTFTKDATAVSVTMATVVIILVVIIAVFRFRR